MDKYLKILYLIVTFFAVFILWSEDVAAKPRVGDVKHSQQLHSARMPRSTDLSALAENCGKGDVEIDQSQNQSLPGLKGGNIDEKVGRFEAPYGTYPWQAQIMVSYGRVWYHLCGGTILSTYHILTAAHCVTDYAQSMFKVLLGHHNSPTGDEGEQSFTVRNVYIHDNYINVTLGYDIALLHVSPEIKFGKDVQPACLPQPDTRYETGKFCHVSGWVNMDVESATFQEDPSPVFRAIQVPLVSDSYCQSYDVFQSNMNVIIRNDMFCAGDIKAGPNTCNGDAGGPLACRIQGRYIVMGIVSFGVSCGEPLFPGVYVRVSSYVGWLQRRMAL